MEKKRDFLLSVLYYLTIAGIVYLVFKYAIFIVMPFLIGFAIAALLYPAVDYLCRTYGLRRKPCGILIMLLFLATVGMLVTILIVRTAVWIGEFSGRLPTLYSESVEPVLAWCFSLVNRIVSWFDDHVNGGLPDRFGDDLEGLFEALRSSLASGVSEFSVKALTKLSGIAAGIPRFIIEFLFAVISAFFFIIDYKELTEFAKARLPAKAVGLLGELKEKFLGIIAKYLRSYALIMLITFGELTLGLFILRVPRAAMYALLIALLDMLPVIGTGGVLIPWALFCIVKGDIGFAAGLLILWGVITLVRNIIEPRIVGRQVGLHPLLALISMFVGTRLFGFVGLILFPLVISILISVLRERKGLTQPGRMP